MIKLSGVVQETMITNGDFDKKEFLLFFIFIAMVQFGQRYG